MRDPVVLERFCEGKFGPEDNQDRLVVTEDFIVVIDGAGGGGPIAGKPSGWVVAEAGAACVQRMPQMATAQEFMQAMTEVTAEVNKGWDGTHYRPAMQVAALSVARGELWRVGDISLRIDDTPYPGGKLVDDLRARMRALLIEEGLAAGAFTHQEVVKEKAASPLKFAWKIFTRIQGAYQNRGDGHPLSYGVIDGTPVPERFVEIFPVKDAREIVISSDGFVEPYATLDLALAELKRLQREDPLLYQTMDGNAPFQPSGLFDDSTYVRIRFD